MYFACASFYYHMLLLILGETKVQNNLIITLSLGSIETDRIISETRVIMRLIFIVIKQNNQFWSHYMAVL